MANDAGTRAAAELVVRGDYLVTDEGLAAAGTRPMSYPQFFDLADTAITGVGVYSNLAEWNRQVGE